MILPGYTRLLNIKTVQRCLKMFKAGFASIRFAHGGVENIYLIHPDFSHALPCGHAWLCAVQFNFSTRSCCVSHRLGISHVVGHQWTHTFDHFEIFWICNHSLFIILGTYNFEPLSYLSYWRLRRSYCTKDCQTDQLHFSCCSCLAVQLLISGVGTDHPPVPVWTPALWSQPWLQEHAKQMGCLKSTLICSMIRRHPCTHRDIDFLMVIIDNYWYIIGILSIYYWYIILLCQDV